MISYIFFLALGPAYHHYCYIISCLLILYKQLNKRFFSIITCFKHRKTFVSTVFVLLPHRVLLQVIYFAIDMTWASNNVHTDHVVNNFRVPPNRHHVGHVPVHVIILTLTWPFVVVALHELAKRREIK